MKDSKAKPRKIRLSRYYRLFLFFVMASIEAVMNIANGLLSSATKEVKKSLNMNDAKFGSFGTANSLGRIISSTLFGMLNQKISRKWSTTLNLGFHAIFVLCFHVTNNANILIFVRGLHGFTQMPPSIYVPVWIDQYAIRAYRTVQLTTVQLSQTIGKCVGYFITSDDYFSLTLYRPKLTDEEEKNLRLSCTIYEEQERKGDKVKKGNFFSDLKILSGHSLYILSVICRCILHGINTCLHFWLADFMRTVIHEQNQLKITIYYSIICFAGPVGGMIANAVLKPIIRSYESRRASWPLVFLQLTASIFGVSIGFMKTTLSATIATILFLIFNSSALPIVQGILISCVDKELGATGFAIANILTQVLTSGTTPLLYGIINDRYKEKYPNLAMICIMSLEFLAVPFLCILAYLRNKKFDEEEEKKNENEEELVDK